MRQITPYLSRLTMPALLSSVLLLATGCNRYNANGSLSIFGVIYLIMAIYAVISLLKQDWSIEKKLIWGVVIWFFPIGGSIIYLLFSGRQG